MTHCLNSWTSRDFESFSRLRLRKKAENESRCPLLLEAKYSGPFLVFFQTVDSSLTKQRKIYFSPTFLIYKVVYINCRPCELYEWPMGRALVLRLRSSIKNPTLSLIKSTVFAPPARLVSHLETAE